MKNSIKNNATSLNGSYLSMNSKIAKIGKQNALFVEKNKIDTPARALRSLNRHFRQSWPYERAEKILKSFSVTCSEKNLENSLGICSDSSAFSHGLMSLIMLKNLCVTNALPIVICVCVCVCARVRMRVCVYFLPP